MTSRQAPIWSSNNIRTILTQCSITGVAALGMTLIIVSGGSTCRPAPRRLAATVWLGDAETTVLALQAAIIGRAGRRDQRARSVGSRRRSSSRWGP